MATDGMTELELAIANIPYYRRKGGIAYKQHMARIKNLKRRKKRERLLQD